MTPNDNHQNEGQEKYGFGSVRMCFSVPEWVCVCVRLLTVGFWGAYARILHPHIYYLFAIMRPSRSICTISSVSFSLLHHFVLFHFYLMAHFYLYSNKSTFSQLFALFPFFPAIELSPSLALSCSCLFLSITSFGTTFCYTLNCSFFLPPPPPLLLFASLAFHQALKAFYEIWPNNYDEDESFWKRPVITLYR